MPFLQHTQRNGELYTRWFLDSWSLCAAQVSIWRTFSILQTRCFFFKCLLRKKQASLFFFFCLVFPYLSSALKVGGNTEELGCDVKLQLFFLEVVCERNKKYSGGEQGGEKKKNDLLVVPWAAFPLLSGVRGPRAAAQRQGNGAVRCQALAPLPAVQ